MELPKVVPQHIIDDEAQQIFRTFFNFLGARSIMFDFLNVIKITR
jgi:hypothetical protein